MKRFRTKAEFKGLDEVYLNWKGEAEHALGGDTLMPRFFGLPINAFTIDNTSFVLEDWMWTTDPLPGEVIPSSEIVEEVAKRYNSGKIDLSLIPVEASLRECEVWQDGEKKYGRDNWKKLWGEDTINVACASALRHLFDILDGKLYDEESGKPNAAHVRCNMAMILEYMKNLK